MITQAATLARFSMLRTWSMIFEAGIGLDDIFAFPSG
jgi:hypothetical protein